MKYERGSFITVGSRDTLRGLHPTAQALYMWLSSYANETGNCFPSRKTLAKDVGCSEDTIDKMLILLMNAQLLEKAARFNEKAQTSNLYTVLVAAPSRQKRPPSPPETAGVAARNGTNSNYLTQPIEIVVKADTDFSLKKESRKEDKLSIYHLFSKTEQPWWRYKQEKEAALSLFDLVGVAKIASRREMMRDNSDDTFCPQAHTPSEFAQKLPKIDAYAKRNR